MAGKNQFLSQFFIKIGGSDVPEELMDDLIEVVVDSSLYLPEMFTILLDDSQLKWADNTKLLKLGAMVEILAEVSEEYGGGKGSLMKGEIAALEPDFSATGHTCMLIRGYNKSHRLHRGKKSRTFLKTKDSDIVKKIAQEAGLSAVVDATSVTHEYVLQNNQTNMEFLQSRAERLGYKVFAASGKLYFKKGDAKLGDGPELKLGEALRSFQPILAATHQADKVVVRGWDPATKKEIKGQAKPALKQGGVEPGAGMAKKAFGAAEVVVVDEAVATPNEATALAQGLANDLGSEFIQAEGVCFGNPKVKAGFTITIGAVGKRFGGKYFVTSAIHRFDKAGYETHFTISGRQPNTISHLVENGSEAGRGLMQGLAIGLVTNIKNTKKDWAYVKVKYPWLGDNIESDWIRVTGPGAGGGRGIYWLPEVNDEVVLGFEHGDIHRPFVIGSVWNGKDKPPVAIDKAVGSDGKVDQRVIKSRSGHMIVLNDAKGKEQILVKSKSGHQLLLDDAGGKEKFILKDKSGSNQVVIDSTKNAITIKATQDLTLKCGNKLTLDCTELAVTAKAKAQIKANAALSLESTGKSEIKGAQVSLNGMAQTEVKGGAMVMIQGGIVKIN
ncbi:MAG: VgrG-related protein [Anaerolineales bacterium]|nr:VgrG-related protein [Anaerolineales bacterium]